MADEGDMEEAAIGQQLLIYAFVARGTVVLAEYTEFTGNFTSIASQCLVKLPDNNTTNQFSYNCDGHTFNYLVEDGFAYCVVAIESVGQQMPIAFLFRVKDDFSKRYGGGKAATVSANNLNREFGSKLKRHMQYCVDHSEEVNKLAKVHEQVKNVVMENIEKVLHSTERIKLFVDKNISAQVTCDRDWKKEGEVFVDKLYTTWNSQPEKLHELYNDKCDITWDVLDVPQRIRKSEDVHNTMLKSPLNKAYFRMKYHAVQKRKKSINIVARGVYRSSDKRLYNFLHCLVVHRHQWLILNEVLFIVPNVFSYKIKGKTASSLIAAAASDEDMLHKDVTIIFNPACLLHEPLDPAHHEKPDRIRNILARLEKDGVKKRVTIQGSEPAERRHVLAVHSEDYLTTIDSFPLSAEDIKDCPFIDSADMYCSAGTKDAIYLAAGAAIKACDAVWKEGYKKAFALARPPGHHASRERAEGFCYGNNAAIAAKYLQTEYKVDDIALVDIDLHHCNGTQSIFYEDDTVMVFSIHSKDIGYPPRTMDKSCSMNYGCIGQGRGKGYNINVPMNAGYGDADILFALDKILYPLLSSFRPGAIIVSAGFDAAIDDEVGDCKVSPKCYGTIVQRLASYANGKLVLILEGGYGPKSLPVCVSNCIRSLLGDEDACLSKDELSSMTTPKPTTVKTVQKVTKLLKNEWGEIPFRH